ncbi:MAG: DUF2974 domain-containing protein [Oscillospiraceae bacterium]|nr:DUF2974 domain-containing protein [Oscillospiraceae bacterium]
MDNVLDYLDWRGDLSLQQCPFGPVDSLVLCCLTYLRFEELPGERPLQLREAAGQFFNLPPERQKARTPQDFTLLQKAADSRRFSGMLLTRCRSEFIPEEEKQFAAMTFLPEDGSVYLAFRGTDSSLVGWKEDFNMSFLDTVPSQLAAARYLQEAAECFSGPIRLGGHSKGGNLAVYAASQAGPELLPRILCVYNNDGPGFGPGTAGSAGYRMVLPLVQTFLPQSSVVGMLLEHDEPYTVVRSGQVSLLQHDPYSWQVRGRDFVRMEEVTAGSRFVDQTLKSWVAEMDLSQREIFFDTVFQVCSAPGARSFADVAGAWLRRPALLKENLEKLSPEQRRIVRRTVSMLLSAGGRSLQELLRRRQDEGENVLPAESEPVLLPEKRADSPMND